MNQIGEMWVAGVNGTPDLKEAANWFRKAANRGLAKAQFNLGMCCANGQGVSLDPVEAWTWLHLAAEQKFPNAAEECGKVQATMTADQLKEAQAKAAQFKAAVEP